MSASNYTQTPEMAIGYYSEMEMDDYNSMDLLAVEEPDVTPLNVEPGVDWDDDRMDEGGADVSAEEEDELDEADFDEVDAGDDIDLGDFDVDQDKMEETDRNTGDADVNKMKGTDTDNSESDESDVEPHNASGIDATGDKTDADDAIIDTDEDK